MYTRTLYTKHCGEAIFFFQLRFVIVVYIVYNASRLSGSTSRLPVVVSVKNIIIIGQYNTCARRMRSHTLLTSGNFNASERVNEKKKYIYR